MSRYFKNSLIYLCIVKVVEMCKEKNSEKFKNRENNT